MRRFYVLREPTTGRYCGDAKKEKWVNTVTEAYKAKNINGDIIVRIFVMPDFISPFDSLELPSIDDMPIECIVCKWIPYKKKGRFDELERNKLSYMWFK
jgi:hypothetical protein